jgi:hypothetical protein
MRRIKLVPILFVVLLGMLVSTHTARASGTVANAFQILTGFTAKEACSCAFVVQQPDDYCKAFGSQPGYNEVITIDHGAQTVSAMFVGTTRTARATTAGGCTLDALP